MLLSHFNIAYWHCTTKTFIFWCKLGRVRLCFKQDKKCSARQLHQASGVTPERWSYPRSAVLPQQGGANPGAQSYLMEGWSYLRTVVIPHRSELPQECGVTSGGRNTSEGWSYSTVPHDGGDTPQGGVTPGARSYPRRVQLTHEGGVTPGGCSYPMRAELPQEGGITPEGRSYPRTVEIPQERGVTLGWWRYPRSVELPQGGRSYPRRAELPQDSDTAKT